jgi:hypothetical protein
MKLCLASLAPPLAPLAFAGVIALALAGCGAQAGSGDMPGPITFAPESGDVSGATVFLRGKPALGNQAVFDVVARGADDVHGAAFRVSYDAETLSFAHAEAGPAWSKRAFAIAKEGTPGQLAVSWSERGETGIEAKADTVLGTLTFEVRGRKSSPVTFKVERSGLVDRKGTKVAATWRGGSLAAR